MAFSAFTENICDYIDHDDNEIEEEVYDVYDDGCEGSYMSYIFCPTLQQLFEKYNYNIETICYEPLDELSEDPDYFKCYVIDFRRGKGEIVI
jgi:hypothetical protein